MVLTAPARTRNTSSMLRRLTATSPAASDSDIARLAVAQLLLVDQRACGRRERVVGHDAAPVHGVQRDGADLARHAAVDGQRAVVDAHVEHGAEEEGAGGQRHHEQRQQRRDDPEPAHGAAAATGGGGGDVRDRLRGSVRLVGAQRGRLGGQRVGGVALRLRRLAGDDERELARGHVVLRVDALHERRLLLGGAVRPLVEAHDHSGDVVRPAAAPSLQRSGARRRPAGRCA